MLTGLGPPPMTLSPETMLKSANHAVGDQGAPKLDEHRQGGNLKLMRHGNGALRLECKNGIIN